MYNIILLFASLVLFIGCSAHNEPQYSTKKYTGVQKDQVLHAVKKIFRAYDDTPFLIDSYRNDVNVTHRKAVYQFLNLSMRNDYFTVHVTEVNNTSTAIVSISRGYGPDDDGKVFMSPDNPIFKLFWKRMDYFLGLKKDWYGCREYAPLNYMNYMRLDYNGFLCDSMDIPNNKVKDSDKIDLNATRIISPKPIKSIMLLDKNQTRKENRKDAFKKASNFKTDDKLDVMTPEEKAVSDKKIEKEIIRLNKMLKNGTLSDTDSLLMKEKKVNLKLGNIANIKEADDNNSSIGKQESLDSNDTKKDLGNKKTKDIEIKTLKDSNSTLGISLDKDTLHDNNNSLDKK